MSVKKILIIYEKMGMGHLRVARIVENALRSNTDFTIINQAGSELFGINDVVVISKFWNYCVRKNWLKLADRIINFLLRLLFMPVAEVSELVPIYQKLTQIQPDIIISTADAWNNILGSYAYKQNIPFYIVITELSVFIDLVNPSAVHICYFPETANAIHSFDFQLANYSTILYPSLSLSEKIRYILQFYRDYLMRFFSHSIYRNINRNYPVRNQVPVKVIGPIAEKKHYSKQNMTDVLTGLGISANFPKVLILSGSIGGRILLKIISIISKAFQRPASILVMCGNDRLTYEKIKKSYSRPSMLQIIPYRFQNNLEQFMSVSDCIIARPSAGIFMESLLHRTPMIAYGHVTSNDKGTLEIIGKYRTGECCKNGKSLGTALSKVLEKQTEYRENIDRLLAGYSPTYEALEEKLQSILLSSEKLSEYTNTEFSEDLKEESFV